MVKKIWFLSIIILLSVVGSKVNAATYEDKFDENWFYIDNEFVNKTKNGSTKYQQMSMIVRKSDNSFAYCIEPGKSINESKNIIGYDYDHASKTNLTSQQWDRIKLLAFYGYGYEGHMDIKWYVITQYMIWQTNNLGYDIYFTDKLNGNRIEKYTQEMVELDNLVNSHYTIPNFKEKQIELFWGENKQVVDKNNVLSKFSINNGPDVEASISNNVLNLTSKNYGSSYVIFQKQEKRFYRKPVVYVDPINQDLLVPGDLPNLSHRIEIQMNYGNVSINKLDYDTKSNEINNSGSLENAKYGLYNTSDELLETQYTDAKGLLSFNTKLNTNKYYIQEISPSIGYQLDDTKYYFDINKDNYNVHINVYEKVIKENFEIIKVLDDKETGKLEFEKGIEFGIYDLDNNIIKTYVTSEYGTINFSLPYGQYILKQHTSYDGYEKIDDYKIIVKENNKNNKLVFKDNMIKYKVKLNVKNKDTLKDIDGIKFQIYDKDNNKLCYKIQYPNESNICEYETDKDGNIYFPQDFKFNEYYIKLIYDKDFKYIFDNDTIRFEINKNTKYKEEKQYRLIELEYFLNEKKIIKELEETKKDNENQNIKNEIELIEKQEVKSEEIVLPNIEEGLVVKVPNTLKNDKVNLLYLSIICIIVLKKIFNYIS